MQHFVMNNFSYTSQQRQEKISNDINSIIILISTYKKSNKIKITDDTNNQSLTLKRSHNKKFTHQQSQQNQQQEQYIEHGLRFMQLTYDQLLYLLCRKQILHEFVQQFIEEKYQVKNFHYLNEKLAESIKEIFDNNNNNSPEISLQQCMKERWIEIFSKEDIFYDVIEILKSSISKNWKVNQIKYEKKLQQSSNLVNDNDGSKIFHTQPNLDVIEVNQIKGLKGIKSKQGIQQSTRQILNGLQKLRKQMEQCQAEMNMAKNNENKILQKNKQYSNKKKQYNELKQIYRKRTQKKQQNKDNKGLKNNVNTKQQILNESLSKVIPIKEIDSNNNAIKLPQVDQMNFGQQNKKTKTLIDQMKQQQEDQLQKKSIIQHNSTFTNKKQLYPESTYDELINILDVVNKNQYKNQRISKLVEVQPEKTKKSITEVSHAKGTQDNCLVNSSKQQFLDKYVKRVFNHYIKEQSIFRNLSLFDKNLSGSELNFRSFVTDNKKGGHIDDGYSPLMRKKFSAQIAQSINKDVDKRRMSLAYPPTVQHSYYLKNKNIRKRIKTIDSSSLSQQYQAVGQKKQPQLSLQSYSKFAKAFNLSTKTVTLNEIVQLFKKKSLNKKSISYNQFLELFEIIYRLECERIQIEFTAVMFDNYLKKEIFSWNKINKVLRLKTIDVNPFYKHGKSTSNEKHQIKSNHSGYKFNLVGHSGRLSEQIMQKICNSKKPFDKMPCMNNKTSKTLPVTTEEENSLPKTRIQIKIEQIRKLRQLQKARKKQQLEAYLLEESIRTEENDEFINTKQQDINKKNQNINKSYIKRYKMIQHKKKKQINQKTSKLNNHTTNQQIINSKKLHQQQSDKTRSSNNQQHKTQHKNTRNLTLMYTNQEEEQQMERQIVGKNHNTNRRVKTVEPSYETIQKSQKTKTNQDIIELQKIIGIRESDDQSDYSEDIDQNYSPVIINEQTTKQKKISNNSQDKAISHQIINSISEYENERNNSNNKRSRTKKQLQPSLYQQSSRERTSLTKKKKKTQQQDEYLASYLSKQSPHISPIRYLQHQQARHYQHLSNNFQTEPFKNGRQNWRVHF